MRPSIATGRVARRSVARILMKQPAQVPNGMLRAGDRFHDDGVGGFYTRIRQCSKSIHKYKV